MFIDGQFFSLSNAQCEDARRQLGLPPTFNLVEATGKLFLETGNRTISINLPSGLLVAAFESTSGIRSYGVIRIQTIAI